MKQRIIGVVPARMGASRFPGKPLAEIRGKSMLRHVADKATEYEHWNAFVIATCDQEIVDHIGSDHDVVMTSETHDRALDRVAEAYLKVCVDPRDDDIIVCVQGDEPMLELDMIEAIVKPIHESVSVTATVLAMPIVDEQIWLNRDTVKLVFNDDGKVLYTSRAPIPFAKQGFSLDLGAFRIVGVFAFTWASLREFTEARQSRLEILEACDSNRIFELSFDQYVAPISYRPCFSVDSPADIRLVDDSWGDTEV